MKPDFIIIGSMKCGTTTVHDDLSRHERIFMGEQKEPEILMKLKDKKSMLRDYSRLFSGKKEGQILGEASTAYTKYNSAEVSCANLKMLLGGDGCKFIFIYRDPVDRALSQIKHDYAHHEIDYKDEAYLLSVFKNGIYDECLKPWLDNFPFDSFYFVRFEEYIDNREEKVEDILRFLGIFEGFGGARPDLSARLNSADERVVVPKILRFLVTERYYYRYFVKNIISGRFRSVLANIFNVRSDNSDVPVEDLKWLRDRFEADYGAHDGPKYLFYDKGV